MRKSYRESSVDPSSPTIILDTLLKSKTASEEKKIAAFERSQNRSFEVLSPNQSIKSKVRHIKQQTPRDYSQFMEEKIDSPLSKSGKLSNV